MTPGIGRWKIRKIRSVRGDVLLIVTAKENRVAGVTRHVPVKARGVRVQLNRQPGVKAKTAGVSRVAGGGVIGCVSSGRTRENPDRHRIDVYNRHSAQRDSVKLRRGERDFNAGVRAKLEFAAPQTRQRHDAHDTGLARVATTLVV